MVCTHMRRWVARFGYAVGTVTLGMGLASGASATTLNIQEFDRQELALAQNALAAFRDAHGTNNFHVETFENEQAWDGASGTSDPVTNVGRFTTLGGTGSGNAMIHDGNTLEVREDNNMFWGRYDTDGQAGGLGLAGGHWLDSNDTYGMRWEIGGLGAFDTIGFFVTDAADVGGKFSVKVGETLFSNIVGATGREANGNIRFVQILLPEAVESLTVELFHDRLNDGFGIDGAMVAQILPTPLPPAAALMLPGLAAFAALRRRRRPAA